ncbi:BT2A1 protein, partial [Halcyon senegalensis]|nr:BT2A1 protein [Halcyon senegalensis]
QFISSPPKSSIVGVIGESVILPCQVVADNIPEVFSVHWIFHEQSQKITVSGYDGKNKEEKQNERYQGRTEFFCTEFRAGNMSLLLKNIRISDKGSYTCVVSFNGIYHHVLVGLQVAAKGGAPSIFMKTHKKQGIGLTCHAAGWFPKPEVIWLDGQRQVRKELSTTNMTMMPAGLYSVVTYMNLQTGSDMEVSCRIVSNLLNTTSESRVLISDIFFPTISKWPIVFLVILCLSMVLISTVFYKLRSKYFFACILSQHREIAQQLRLKSMTSFSNHTRITQTLECFNPLPCLCTERSLNDSAYQIFPFSPPVAITLNPDCRVLKIQVEGARVMGSTVSDPAGTSTLGTVPVLVGKEGFAAGKHYWEVDMGQEQDWVLGVVREKGGQEEERILPGEDYWALHKSHGEIFSSEGDLRIEKQQMSNPVIGVLLDLEEGQVNFYEAEQRYVIVKMALRLGKEQADNLF